MRVARFVSVAALAWLMAFGLAVTPQAQAPSTEEEFDKLMKSVGATVGSLVKNLKGDMADAAAADAKKMVELQKQNAAFWTARKNTEAAGWATEAMNHAIEIDKALMAKNMASALEHQKQLGGVCQTCHAKNREKTADGGWMMRKQ
jgi:cytochrome c556